uniref:Serine-threonine/tyrosine-protein kinase catalytic domain-containing protein n=1 Tax=Acrobeloides nanus TaxID=290746 RepID=A0A914DB47_9BILA
MDDIEDLGVFAATRIVVRKLKHKLTNIEMATKYIAIPKSQIDTIIVNTTLDKIIREIENFKELSKCPQIVDLYGVCIHDFQALLCMELMDYSVHDYYLYVHRKVHEQVPEETMKLVIIAAILLLGTVSMLILNAVAVARITPLVVVLLLLVSNILVLYGDVLLLIVIHDSDQKFSQMTLFKM